MAYTKIPVNDAVLLVRALGLLVSQAGIYGPSHKVTQSAAKTVFAELEEAVRKYGPVEIALKDKRVLLNGSIDGLDVAAGKNLVDRMNLHKIGGMIFLPPPDLSEFLTCITLFGTPPASLAAQGGFGDALKKAGLRSVQVVTVEYQRVADQEIAMPLAPPSAETLEKAAQRRSAADSGILDLSAAWERDFGMKTAEPETPPPEMSPRSVRQERAATLAALLRDTAALLEQEGALSDEAQHQKVLSAITRIRDTLVKSTAESERQIAALADQVDDDRQTIASIESAAKRRGIGLKISRAELVERYAELNQEIVQPLTVSTGVIDLLHSGKGGPLTESQRDLLKLASDSVERVNQLVAYMSRIAGLPESFTPDSTIISDSYR
ncbi:MAG TPA: hypothetical protein PKM57_15885 [Kiritimatiellia bacterium]|nr:hypothetical protein [Kiritimatiellia bacterium]HPS07392.1 hypothetical protein [Kiritimatiellia bacterium]